MNNKKILENNLKITARSDFIPNKSYNKSYYKEIPHKLYKYRECNDDNFNALENEYLWLVPAKKFEADPLDCTIKYDLYNQKEKIEDVLKKYLPEIIFSELSKVYSKCRVNLTRHKDFIQGYFKNQKKEFDYKDSDEFIKELKKVLIINGIKGPELTKIIKELEKALSDDLMKKQSEKLVAVLNGLNDVARKKFYNTCLTEDYKNNNMWNQYAHKYSGFCIAYDLGFLYKNDFKEYLNLYALRPIIYEEKEEFDITLFLELALEKYLDILEPKKMEDLNYLLLKQLMIKHPSFSYEKEWRIMIEKKNVKNNEHYFRFTKKIYAGKDIEAADLQKLKIIAKKLNVPLYMQKLNASKSEYVYELVLDSN